jgi:hypothetical protein
MSGYSGDQVSTGEVLEAASLIQKPFTAQKLTQRLIEALPVGVVAEVVEGAGAPGGEGA